MTGKFVTKPMSFVAALHLYRIKLGTKLIRSLHPLWLGQGRSLYKGGGGYNDLWAQSSKSSTCLLGGGHPSQRLVCVCRGGGRNSTKPSGTWDGGFQQQVLLWTLIPRVISSAIHGLSRLHQLILVCPPSPLTPPPRTHTQIVLVLF